MTVGICGDAKMVSQQLLAKLSEKAGNNGEDRKNLIHQTKSAWLQTLSGLDHEDDDPAQYGIKKLEREIKIECHHDKLGEQFKLQFLMMLS